MRKKYCNVTIDQLREEISYNPLTGEFLARRRRGVVMAGEPAVPQGSGVLDVCGISMTLGRSAWALATGEWPKGMVKRRSTSVGFLLENLVDTGVSGPVKKSKPKLTLERLRQVLRYCPASGLFSWVEDMSSTARKGEVAGCASACGYTLIRIDGTLHSAHRLAYFYIHGFMPPAMVDHLNGIRSDNRMDNLRAATASQNAQNKQRAIGSNRKTGLLGVYWAGRLDRWGAKVNHEGRQYHAGFHETPEAAHQAYLEKKRELHEFCTI